MLIDLTPRISGAFTNIVIKNTEVSGMIREFDLTEEEAHDFVKKVIITAFSIYKININDVINSIKEHEQQARG